MVYSVTLCWQKNMDLGSRRDQRTEACFSWCCLLTVADTKREESINDVKNAARLHTVADSWYGNADAINEMDM